MDNKKIIGQRINTALALSGKMQKDLAAVLGVTDNTVSYYVGGKRSPSTEQVIEIAKYLGVTSDYLLGLSDTPSPDIEDQAICKKLGIKGETLSALKNIFEERTFESEKEDNDFWRSYNEAYKEKPAIAQLFILFTADAFHTCPWYDFYRDLVECVKYKQEIKPLQEKAQNSKIELEKFMSECYANPDTWKGRVDEVEKRMNELISEGNEISQMLNRLEKDSNGSEWGLMQNFRDIIYMMSERYGDTWQV